MSLEAAIQENTAAVKELIETLKATEANRAAVLAATETAISTANAPKRTKKTEEASASTAAPAAVSPPPPPPPAAVAAPSAEEVLKHFGAYVGVEDDALRDTRKGSVRKILEKVGAPKVSEIAEAKRAEAIELLQQQIASEKAAAAAEDDLM